MTFYSITLDLYFKFNKCVNFKLELLTEFAIKMYSKQCKIKNSNKFSK